MLALRSGNQQSVFRITMNSYRCGTCGRIFSTKRALGGHRSRGVCRISIANCNTNARQTHVITAPVITAPVTDATHFAHYCAGDNQSDVATFSITQLLQRPLKADATHRVAPARLTRPLFRCDTVNTYRLHEVVMYMIYNCITLLKWTGPAKRKSVIHMKKCCQNLPKSG